MDSIPTIPLRQRFEIDLLSQRIEEALQKTDRAHDYAHIERVRRLAREIGQVEKVDLEMVDLIALLHEVGDRKVLPDKTVGDFLPETWNIGKISNMVKAVSWSSGNLFSNLSPENQSVVAVVADADRLEALGATGIARCLIYSGAHQRPLYSSEPARIPCPLDEYKKTDGASAINHFFEKLLVMEFRTETGRKLAQPRKERMIEFLLSLSEETGYKYPPAAQKLLHIDIEVTRMGPLTLFKLPYLPLRTSEFEQAVREKYETWTAFNLSERSFLIQGSLTDRQVLDLIWKYLPNPRVLKAIDVGEVSASER